MNPLAPNIMHLFNAEPVSEARGSSANDLTEGFGSVLRESMETARATDVTDKASTLELLMGEADDLSGLMIDMQKAELSLQLTLQIRNNIIDAYNEVMRMNI